MNTPLLDRSWFLAPATNGSDPTSRHLGPTASWHWRQSGQPARKHMGWEKDASKNGRQDKERVRIPGPRLVQLKSKVLEASHGRVGAYKMSWLNRLVL